MKGNITQRLFLAVSCLFFQGILWGQTQKIHTLEMNDGTLSGSVVMNADALIDMQSSKKGLLLPRVALVDAKKPAPLTAHTAGMTVYNTATVSSTVDIEGVTPGYYYNNGTKWVRLTTEVEAEWKDGTNLIYAKQAKEAGNDVVITDDGKVGIGTAAPLAKLHLVIDNLDGGVKNDLLIDEYKNIPDWTPITMEHFRGTPDNPEPLQNGDVLGGILDHVYLSNGSIINRAAGIMNIYTGDGSNNLGKMTFFTSDVERMSITDDGNVGIGTTEPKAKLDVNDGRLAVSSGGSGLDVSGVFYIAVSDEPDDFDQEVILSSNSKNQEDVNRTSIFIGPTPNGVLAGYGRVQLSGGDVWVSSGNMRIGKQEPATEKLEVAGKVKATNFIATATGSNIPDYVFETYYNGSSKLNTEYSFMNLSEVEAFTKANNHLPGYETASAIAEKGSLDIVDVQLKNIEKIEELYLHLIEKEKEVKALKSRLQEQGGDIKQQQQEIEELKTLVNQLLKK